MRTELTIKDFLVQLAVISKLASWEHWSRCGNGPFWLDWLLLVGLGYASLYLPVFVFML